MPGGKRWQRENRQRPQNRNTAQRLEGIASNQGPITGVAITSSEPT
jgi:hypothetical protein